MALIECDECGKDVSDKAASCPGCGNPIATPDSILDIPPSSSTQDTSDEGIPDFTPLMRNEGVWKKYEEKSSYIKQGLKRLSIFASIIWIGCWYYNLEVTHSRWFEIYYWSDEYTYLGLFGLFCIWASQFLVYWVISGFIKDKKELALENDNYKKIVSNQFKNIEENIFMKGETLFLIIVFVSLLFLLFREL
jgi:hypothetical protein